MSTSELLPISNTSNLEGPVQGTSFVGPWITWRIWNSVVYTSLEEHLQTGNFLYSRLALGKLFLHKLGIWDTGYSFHNPTTLNFMKVIPSLSS